MTDSKHEPATPSQKHRWIPILCSAIVVCAIGLSLVDSHWFSHPSETESPLGPDNARLEMTPQPFWKDSDKSFYMNFLLTNAGKNTALRMYRFGIGMASNANLDPDLIDAFFIMFRAKLKKTNTTATNEFPPGFTGQFFSVPDTTPGLQFGSDEGYAAAKDGKLPIYSFVLERYRDGSLPVGKFIYSERCIYLVAGVVHNCEQGHNRSYIAD